MKILFLAHMWCPIHNAGGETTAHSAMREMVRRGHDVTVFCRPQSEGEGAKFDDYEFEGVKVRKCPIASDQVWVKENLPKIDPDLLITHLDLTILAMQTSIDSGKPLAHWVHNTTSFEVFGVSPHKCQLAIFNSQWVADYHQWLGAQIVIHPTVEPERYRCEKGTKITLVNPTPGKGADTFYALAKVLPDYEFLCVKSVYGEQIAVPNISAHLHPNVETMEHTADIREALRKTRVLLMPSNYESYGRVAVEAACSGIPTIAHPTPGLKESLGEAGIFCDRDDIPAWRATIERLYTDEVYYRKRSDLALELANNLDPESEFDRLEEALLVTVSHWNNRQEESNMQMWITDREIYKNAQGNLTTDRAQAMTLYRGKNQRMPLDEAVALGLAQPLSGSNHVTAHQVERDLDTWALNHPEEAKAQAEPAENKAIEAPEENKAKRKKKSEAA